MRLCGIASAIQSVYLVYQASAVSSLHTGAVLCWTSHPRSIPLGSCKSHRHHCGVPICLFGYSLLLVRASPVGPWWSCLIPLLGLSSHTQYPPFYMIILSPLSPSSFLLLSLTASTARLYLGLYFCFSSLIALFSFPLRKAGCLVFFLFLSSPSNTSIFPTDSLLSRTGLLDRPPFPHHRPSGKKTTSRFLHTEGRFTPLLSFDVTKQKRHDLKILKIKKSRRNSS